MGPTFEPLEPRLLLDGDPGGQAGGLLAGEGVGLGYDPAWIAQPPEPHAEAGQAKISSAGSPPGGGTGVFDILVEQGLQASIQDSLDTYVSDLVAEGYTVSVQEWSGPADALRSHLRARHETAGLEGALFVGDLPTLTFTHAHDFNDQTVSFVHDLYFMDLDGTYALSDSGPDLHFDGDGDIAPEIYVSRITTSTITGMTGQSEAELIRRYFAKVHAYRAGLLTYENRGILWSDNDWRYTDYFMAGDDLYEEVLNVRDDSETTLQNYVDCLHLDYESMMFMAHSVVTSHSIRSPGGGGLSSTAIRDLNPRQGFYNLWNCSSGNFTVPSNLICTYVYSGDYGLNAVGTTKTGAMLGSYDYYRPQGAGYSVGQAFRSWWEACGNQTDSLKSWHYGMTMQGDPTLRPAAMGDLRLLADAGADRQANIGQDMPLDGSGTYVAEGFGPTWLWEQLSGPTGPIDGADEMVATFTPTETGTYVFRLTATVGEVISTDEVTLAVVTAVPTSLDLLPSSDTGQADDDDLTSLDNGAADRVLEFLVGGTTEGALVAVYADGAILGAEIATADTTLVVTDGTHRLADGVRSITSRQTEPGQAESADSPALLVRIDTQAPQIAAAYITDATHAVIEFTEPLDAVTAEAVDHYRIDPDATVVSASIGGGPQRVRLALAQPLMEAVDYTLTVQGVADRAGNRIEPPAQRALHAADPSLLVWWAFDDGAGGTATDASGHGHDGQVVGADWEPEGRIGGALHFYGDGDYTYVLDDDAEEYLNGLGAITVALWIKSEETGTERGFFTTRDPPDKECMSMRYNGRGANGGADDTMKAYVQTTVDKHRTEGQEHIQTTEWQHVAMTWTAQGAIILYADGAVQDLSYDQGSLGGATSGTEKLLVGTAYKDPDGAWRGLIDDVRIYDRALGDGEIAALANVDPLAHDDNAYELDQDNSLVVAAGDGVLANDVDPDAGPAGLTAWLVAEPVHGEVALQPDGAFHYTPLPGYSGTDTFRYQAYDGLEYGNVAEATVIVRDTAPPVVLAAHVVQADGSIVLGFSEPVTISKADLAVIDGEGNELDLAEATLDHEPGTGEARLSFSGRPAAGYCRVLVRGDGVRDLAGNLLDGDGDGGSGGDHQELLLVAPVGDATLDGRVDAADYVMIKKNVGRPAGATWAQADFDGDGDVDRADFLRFEANFGASVAPPAPLGEGGQVAGEPGAPDADRAAAAIAAILSEAPPLVAPHLPTAAPGRAPAPTRPIDAAWVSRMEVPSAGGDTETVASVVESPSPDTSPPGPVAAGLQANLLDVLSVARLLWVLP